jgi:hypothetical protein
LKTNLTGQNLQNKNKYQDWRFIDFEDFPHLERCMRVGTLKQHLERDKTRMLRKMKEKTPAYLESSTTTSTPTLM